MYQNQDLVYTKSRKVFLILDLNNYLHLRKELIPMGYYDFNTRVPRNLTKRRKANEKKNKILIFDSLTDSY